MNNEPQRRKIKELEVMVADIVYETPDTRTLVLFSGNDLLEYQPGHFLTIAPQQFAALERWTTYLEHIKGKKEPPRAYSITSAPYEKHLAITVKEERYVPGSTLYPPLLSPILALRTSPGTRMIITGFTGPYTLPEDAESSTDHILHICAGSGIVPSYSIIKQSIHHQRKLKHTLIYSNKSWSDTIFGNALLELQKKHPEQFRVIFTVTRETEPAVCQAYQLIPGRITKEIIQEHTSDVSHQLVFVCGPSISAYDKQAAKKNNVEPKPRFMESVLQYLKEIGFPPNRIKKESYG